MNFELFERDEYAALEDDCEAVGKKEVALMLKSREPGFNPDKFDPEDGARWVSSCLSRKRGHKFDLDEITLIVNAARKVGSYSYVTLFLAKAYFEPTKPQAYEIEVQRIGSEMEKIAAAATRCNEAIQNINRELKK